MALATGLMMPWLPVEQPKTLQIPNMSAEGAGSNDKARKPSANTKKTQTALTSAPQSKAFAIPSEAVADLKKALEVNLDSGHLNLVWN